MKSNTPGTLRWPPIEDGLPAEPIKAVLDTQQDLLTALRHAVGESDDLWKQHYMPVIMRYLRWVHLLPASREHHHYGAGGLWCHGLEAARAAADLYERRVIGQGMPRDVRRRYRQGLRWAAVCGALLHDCAKPLSDVEITGEQGETWNPIQGSLAAWLQSTGTSRYWLHWRKQREGRHMVGAAIMLPRIMGLQAQVWLQVMCGQETLLEMVTAIMDDAREGMLSDLIHESDRLSVAQDMGRRSEINEDHRITGVAAERQIIDAMHSLLREGQWKPGGKVCIAAPDNEVLLSWPRAGQDIGSWLSAHQIPGIMRSPDALADVLIDTGRAVPCGGDRFWRFRLKEGVKITGLRLKAGLLDMGDAEVGGDWPETADTQEKAAQTPSGKASSDPAASEAPSTAKDPIESRPQPATQAVPAEDAGVPASTARVADCVMAKAIFEDIANGQKPLELLYTYENHPYLRYPDAFKGYGMSPMQAAKEIVESGLAETDGKRVAVETGDSIKGTRLLISGPPLVDEAPIDYLVEWFPRQTTGATDIKSLRYIETNRVRRWASLFGSPDEIIEELKKDDQIRMGNFRGKSYIRLKDINIDEKQSGDV